MPYGLNEPKSDADLFNGYKTFVSIPDPDRDKVQDGGHIKDIRYVYQYPRKFDRVRETDYEYLQPSFNSGRSLYKDPSLIEKNTDEYRDFLTASVVSQWLMENHPVTYKPVMSRVAITMRDLDHKLSHDIKDRARDCRVRLKRSMPRDNRYIFEVKSHDGSHAVTVKIDAKRNIKDIEKADVQVACSCNFWIFYGPEYHAKRHGYLDGSTKGTATPPRIRDPRGTNMVCKHVFAVFQIVKKYDIHGNEPKNKRRQKEIEEIEDVPEEIEEEVEEVEEELPEVEEVEEELPEEEDELLDIVEEEEEEEEEL
jgi:hypothetical protein